MKTVQVSRFKARCLGLLKDVRATCGAMAIVRPPLKADLQKQETVEETLQRLRPLLLIEDEDLEAPRRIAE